MQCMVVICTCIMAPEDLSQHIHKCPYLIYRDHDYCQVVKSTLPPSNSTTLLKPSTSTSSGCAAKTLLEKMDKFKDTKEFEMLATKMIKERLGMTHDKVVEFKTGRTGQCNYFFVLIH